MAVFEEKLDNHARYSKYRGVYALLISFLKQFKKLFFHLIEHALRSLLVFKYLWLFFEEKSDNHARYSKYRCVYALLISFLKQFKKFFFYLIEHALRSLLVFKYLRLFLRKSKITAGDTLNSRSFNLTFRRKKPERSRVRLLVLHITH